MVRPNNKTIRTVVPPAVSNFLEPPSYINVDIIVTKRFRCRFRGARLPGRAYTSARVAHSSRNSYGAEATWHVQPRLLSRTQTVHTGSNQTTEPISNGRNRFPIYTTPEPSPSSAPTRTSYLSQRWIRLVAEQRSRNSRSNIFDRAPMVRRLGSRIVHLNEAKRRSIDVDEFVCTIWRGEMNLDVLLYFSSLYLKYRIQTVIQICANLS